MSWEMQGGKLTCLIGPIKLAIYPKEGGYEYGIAPTDEADGWREYQDEATDLQEAKLAVIQMAESIVELMQSDLEQAKELFLFALVDPNGDLIGDAPFDGTSLSEVKAEILNTYPDVALDALGWKIVPLTTALEEQYRERRHNND